MTSYWSHELKAESFPNPKDILTEAGNELCQMIAKLDFQVLTTEASPMMVHGLEFRNKETDQRLRIVEVYHSVDLFYPCAIKPPTYKLPSELKRRHVIPAKKSPLADATTLSAMSAMSAVFASTPEKIVENDWVCSTPEQLREKLIEALGTDIVKGLIIRLVSLVVTTSEPSQ